MVHTEVKNRISALKIIVTVNCAIMIFCILFKIAMDDFNPSDVIRLLTPLLIIFVANGNRRPKKFVNAYGTIAFGNIGLSISYTIPDTEHTVNNIVG